MSKRLRLTVVGGGWAGLAAAVEATRRGHQVRLLEMAPQLGGRARSIGTTTPGAADERFDNGQHILIGAYQATLALMRQVGVNPEQALLRLPLALSDPSGRGLRMQPGAAVPAFVRAVLHLSDWPWRERLALLSAASGWALRRFQCPDDWTVATLTQPLPQRVRVELIEPLCVAALNTPAAAASAQVFLRVLHDALFSGPGASDLLLPRQPLAALLPEPARTWLHANGAEVQLSTRAHTLQARPGQGWCVNEAPCDAVILACSASEAARLTHTVAPAWALSAAGFTYEPIITVYLHCAGARLMSPMVTLSADAPHREPAQFAFDLGAITGTTQAHRFAYVASGAAAWAERGSRVIEEAVRAQALASLLRPPGAGLQNIQVLQTVSEKRATFRCTPKLHRPKACIGAGLWAAGDYVAGPYPATLEGAVRSGLAASAALDE